MYYTWFYVEDELLLTLYNTAVKNDYGKEYCEFVLAEIKNRNLNNNKSE